MERSSTRKYVKILNKKRENIMGDIKNPEKE